MGIEADDVPEMEKLGKKPNLYSRLQNGNEILLQLICVKQFPITLTIYRRNESSDLFHERNRIGRIRR